MIAQVLIVGAGPVGLTLAWRLAGAGVPVMVFEAEEVIPDQLRASTFHPPTLDMFAQSGITEELIACGRVTPDWQIRLFGTGARAIFDLSVLADDTGFPFRLQCRQAELSHALMRRLPKDIVRFGASVSAVGTTKEGVWVEVAGTRISGSYLIGCDGARSIVRTAMGVSFTGTTYPESTILATTDLPFEDHIEGLSGVNYLWQEHGTFSLLRLPDLWRMSLHPRDGETAGDALEDRAIIARISEVAPDAPQVQIREKRVYRVHRKIVDRYVSGRMVLAGDAAHLNSPKGGMGMNGGIHDAMALGDALIKVADGADASALLARYDRQRRPVAAEEILKQADDNRARMNTTDPQERAAHLTRLQAIAADRAEARRFLRKSSMIDGLRQSEATL